MDGHLPSRSAARGALIGCGDDSAASTQNKRLGDQGPCDLVEVEDLGEIFGPADDDPGPRQEGDQCLYTFEKGAPAIGRRAAHGAPFVIDGVAAKKYQNNGTCAVDVWLMPDDLDQQFGVVNIGDLDDQGPCDVSIAVARLILRNLSG